MRRARSFGRFLFIMWLIRDDGATMVRIKLPPFVDGTTYRGFNLRPFNHQHIIGIYHNTKTDSAFGLIIKNPVAAEEEHICLAYIEPSERFERWMIGLVD